jgi:hypothetical protein
VTHWSSWLLAKELGLSNVKVGDVWREYGLAPRRTETFKFSTDPRRPLRPGRPALARSGADVGRPRTARHRTPGTAQTGQWVPADGMAAVR